MSTKDYSAELLKMEGVEIEKVEEAISFDEFKGNTDGQKFQCIVTDSLNRRVFDILPARIVKTIQDYLLSFWFVKDSVRRLSALGYAAQAPKRITEERKISVDVLPPLALSFY